MLRITREIENGTVRLAVSGKVAGPWVDEFRDTVARDVTAGATVTLDLGGVSYADSRGVMLLRDLARHGVCIAGRSGFVDELLRSEDQ